MVWHPSRVQATEWWNVSTMSIFESINFVLAPTATYASLSHRANAKYVRAAAKLSEWIDWYEIVICLLFCSCQSVLSSLFLFCLVLSQRELNETSRIEMKRPTKYMHIININEFMNKFYSIYQLVCRIFQFIFGVRVLARTEILCCHMRVWNHEQIERK